jgi:hypothetical protein
LNSPHIIPIVVVSIGTVAIITGIAIGLHAPPSVVRALTEALRALAWALLWVLTGVRTLGVEDPGRPDAVERNAGGRDFLPPAAFARSALDAPDSRGVDGGATKWITQPQKACRAEAANDPAGVTNGATLVLDGSGKNAREATRRRSWPL